MATFAPSPAKARAVARPIPLLPPVITTPFARSPKSMANSSSEVAVKPHLASTWDTVHGTSQHLTLFPARSSFPKYQVLGCPMYDLKCTCPTTKSPIDELTKWSFCFRQFIHSFYERPLFLDSTSYGRSFSLRSPLFSDTEWSVDPVVAHTTSRQVQRSAVLQRPLQRHHSRARSAPGGFAFPTGSPISPILLP